MSFITLLSDLGYNDATVAKAKSELLQALPGSTIIDITHNVQPFYLPQAAYLLSCSAGSFPAQSFHIALYDLYYNDKPQLILAEVGNNYYLVPDNGLLPLAFPNWQGSAWLCYEQDENGGIHQWLQAIAATISKINQAGHPGMAGLRDHHIQTAPLSCRPIVHGNEVECQVIHIDRFENVVLNITRNEFEELAAGRRFQINLLRYDTITEISHHYNAVKEGEKLCRFNSAGYLEVAINKGNAAGLFGFRLMRERQLMYNTIKITFE